MNKNFVSIADKILKERKNVVDIKKIKNNVNQIVDEYENGEKKLINCSVFLGWLHHLKWLVIKFYIKTYKLLN